MILRKYGKRLESVDPAFSATAFNSIAWQRDGELVMSEEEFEERYEQAALHELTARAEGKVQVDVETQMLEDVEAQVRALSQELDEGEVLLVPGVGGVEAPRSREEKRNVVEEGQNRFHFEWWLDPGLRVKVFRPRD